MCVWEFAGLLVRERVCVCVSFQECGFPAFSNFLCTCASLNCFLYVIDLHFLGTSLSLSGTLFASPLHPPLCTHIVLELENMI